MTFSKNFLIVTAKLLTGGLQYCMFKFILKHKCDAGDGQGLKEFGNHVFLTFVTCLAMFVVVAPFFYKELKDYNRNRHTQGLRPSYPYSLRAHLLTITPALLEVTGLMVSLTANKVLDATVMILLKSIRIPVSAIMNKFIVGRALKPYQITAVVITILGLAPVVYSENLKPHKPTSDDSILSISPHVAIGLVAIAEIFKGVRYVYEERLIKIEKLSSEFLVFMQSLIDTVVSIGFVAIAHYWGVESWTGTWKMLCSSWGLWVLLVLMIALVGFHNYTSTLITENMSSLHNVLISQGRVVVTMVFMVIIELFLPGMGEKLGYHTVFDSMAWALFIVAALVYNGNVVLPWSQCYPVEEIKSDSKSTTV